MDQVKIGKFIAECRKNEGFLQKDIAERLGISEKTVSKWECGKGLPEVVYMEPLCRILHITVNELLAGEKLHIMELMESLDRSRIELVRQLEFEQLKMRIYKLYGIEIDSMEISDNGAGGLTYIVDSCGERFVVKYPSDNEMNHPELEIKVCKELIKRNIPACHFIENKNGHALSTDENGRRFTVQKFYEGKVYDYHMAPKELQRESAVCLARIHQAMKDMEPLPVGIGADFFKHRRPEDMIGTYNATLLRAVNNNDEAIANTVRSNLRILNKLPEFNFDANKFSCGNTHGDYVTSQLIWDEGHINGIIDWTCACRHPYIWEIVRSYVFMAPEVSDGQINIDSLIEYIFTYMEISSLRAYDIENAGNLFYYFLSVCNFYGQYYDSLSKNREIYLKQAVMASKLLKWFSEHIDELNERLKELNQDISIKKKLNFYYDSEGRLTQFPNKLNLRMAVLTKIAGSLQRGKKYSEKEVNDIIRSQISFPDYALIRRELYDYKLIDRTKDGSEYWI